MRGRLLLVCFTLWCTASGLLHAHKPAHFADCTTPPTLFVSKVKRPSIASSTTVCQDSLVQLNLRNYPQGSTFTWQKGGTDIPNAADSVLVVRGNQSGTYHCIVRSPLCSLPIVSTPLVITTNSKPLVSISAGNPIGIPCKEGTIKLTSNSSGNGTLKYQWYFENQPIPSATSNVFDAIETGVYTLKVVDGFDCANVSGALTAITYTPPKADLSTSRAGFCKGEKVTLKATQGRTYLYRWLRDGQEISGIKDSISVAQTGTYTVKVTSPNGCTTESNQISVVQYDDPMVSITSPGNQICPGGTLVLKAQGKDLKTFEWKKEGKIAQSGVKSDFTVTQAGSYTVTVKDTNRCFSTSKSIDIELVTKIETTLTPIPNFCGTTSAPFRLTGTPTGGSFSGKGVMGDIFDPQLAGLGQHTVSYSVKGSVACMNGESRQDVIVSPPPQLDLGADKDLIKGGSIALNADLGPDYRYEWSPNTGVSDIASPTPTMSPSKSTKYVVKAIGPSRCVATDSIYITVFTPLYIPDVFSPNKDGVNDTWEIKGLEDYPDAQISVYNRWGELIYHRHQVSLASFDGNWNGNPLPIGVYTYHILTEPKGQVYRGFVNLLR